MDKAEAITALQELECEFSRLHARQAELLIVAASPEQVVEEFELLDPRPGHDAVRLVRIADAVREEIGCALRWSASVTQDRIDIARLLAGPLSATRDALATGQITYGHVRAIVEAADRLPAEMLDELQRRVLPVACRGTLSATRAAAKRAVLAIDAEGERRRRERAKCTRDVFVIDELDGISTLIARMATADAHAVMSVIDAEAAESDDGLVGERRADALRDLLLGASEEPHATAHVDLVIGLDALLGLTEDSATLIGAGPVAADIVRELLGDESIACTMRRLVVDPVTGHLLDVGRRSYEIPARLRQYIATRDGTCRFPGCRRRADRCQVDHATAWDDGGRTDAANLGALCIRHHQLKTHAGWEITQSRPDGSCTWRSPQGRVYEHPPN